MESVTVLLQRFCLKLLKVTEILIKKMIYFMKKTVFNDPTVLYSSVTGALKDICISNINKLYLDI